MHATDFASQPAPGALRSHAACAELSLAELLADPITQAVMRADRVDPEAAERLFQSAAARISGAPRSAGARFDSSAALPRRRSFRNCGSVAAAAGAVSLKEARIACGFFR